jgi:hypothetical protein
MSQETVAPTGDQATEAVPAKGATTPTTTETGSDQKVQAEASGGQETATDEEPLISDEEFERLQDDPAELRKTLQTAFTQKTQKLAEARRLHQYLTERPEDTIRALAQARGIPLAEAKKEVAAAAETATQPTPEDLLKVALSNALGEEDAERVLPAMKSYVDTMVAPFRTASEQAQMAASEAESQAALKQFDEMYPGWRQHEPAMQELAKHIQPHGLDRIHFLEVLYHGVNHGKAIGTEVNKIVNKMSKAAKAGSEAAVQGGPEQPVPASTAGKKLSLDEAIAMAARGERREE